MPHDERPACKTHTNSISVFSTGRPMQLRTNRRPHAPAPSSVSPVKPHTNPHQPPAPSCANPVKLRSKRHPICLSPGSCGNPVHLRITRVGQATCHQCAEIRRVAEGASSSPPSRTSFPRMMMFITIGILNKQKTGYVSYLSYLSRILAAAPHVAPPGMRTHPVGTRTHRTRADLPRVDRQVGGGVLDAGHRCVRRTPTPMVCRCLLSRRLHASAGQR